jgi:hypothetical protein
MVAVLCVETIRALAATSVSARTRAEKREVKHYVENFS